MSVDPLTATYPYFTPYQFASNTPIGAIDVDGLEASQRTKFIDPFGDLGFGAFFVLGSSSEQELVQANRIAADVTKQVAISMAKSAAKGVIITTYIVWEISPASDGYALITGQDILGNKQSRLVSAAWLALEFGGAGYNKIAKALENAKDLNKAFKVIDNFNDAFKGISKGNPCGCFTAGTKVHTKEGYKNIEDIKVGDLVWAYDDKTADLALKIVTQTYIYNRDTVFHIYIGEEIIKATSDHPFFIEGNWLKVNELSVGDEVQLYSGNKLNIDRIDIVSGDYKVYNFTVDEYHTYYISNLDVLVHNSNPCDVSFGKNMITKFKKHSAEIISAARKNGIDLPKGISKLTTQSAFKGYMKTVVKEGKSYVSPYMTQGDVIWSKYGDSIVLRKLDGEFITHLNTSTKQGANTLKHWDEVVSKSSKSIPLTE